MVSLCKSIGDGLATPACLNPHRGVSWSPEDRAPLKSGGVGSQVPHTKGSIEGIATICYQPPDLQMGRGNIPGDPLNLLPSSSANYPMGSYTWCTVFPLPCLEKFSLLLGGGGELAPDGQRHHTWKSGLPTALAPRQLAHLLLYMVSPCKGMGDGLAAPTCLNDRNPFWGFKTDEWFLLPPRMQLPLQ